MARLATIAQLRVGLLRLVGTVGTDSELVLRGEALNEVIDDALQTGLWNAQRYLIDIGCGDDWLDEATLSFGAADTAGVQRADEPADFLRFAGDGTYSAIHDSDGKPWGALLRDTRAIRTATGNWFYWAGGSICVTRLANLPDSPVLDYYKTIALPSAAAVVDFAEDARPLIIAEAGYHAMGEYWVPAPEGVAQLENRLLRNRLNKRTEAAMAMRRTGARQEMPGPESTGSHYFLT